ncbi:MAG: sigma-70 family RNA polymerase sigma factor [Actinomycetia bacterium]|nr:sigma-70 family RNA polymerase sigma factor [Actinomycetes bacterium]MCH9800682.1 sigma-70 family RNA polymerase sigma factor [Actinomycetes bacterium]
MGSHPAVDDGGIVDTLHSDPNEGFTLLYQAYAERLFAYCTTVLRDRDSAADASHDCLVAAVTKIDTLRSAERLRPWLFAIARNECFKILRNQGKVVTDEEAIEMQSTAPDMSAGVSSSESQQLVYEALQSLSPGDRDVLALALRNDLDAAQVAEAMAVSPNEVRARLSRARSSLNGAVSALVLLRDKNQDCPELQEIVAGAGAELTPLLRKRISRHIKECDQCRDSSHTKALSYVSAFTLPLVLVLPKGFEARAAESAHEALSQIGDGATEIGTTGAGSDGTVPIDAGGASLGDGGGASQVAAAAGASAGKKVAAVLMASGLGAAAVFAITVWVPGGTEPQPLPQAQSPSIDDLLESAPRITVEPGAPQQQQGSAQRGERGQRGNDSEQQGTDANQPGGDGGTGGQVAGNSQSGGSGGGGGNGDSGGGGGNGGSGGGSGGNGGSGGESGGSTTGNSGGSSGGGNAGGGTTGGSGTEDTGDATSGNGDTGNTTGGGKETAEPTPQIAPVTNITVAAQPGSTAGCPAPKWSLSAATSGGPVASVVVVYSGAANGKVQLSGGGGKWYGSLALPQGIYKFYAVAYGEAGNQIQSGTTGGSIKCPPPETTIKQSAEPSPNLTLKAPDPRFTQDPALKQ